MNEVCQVCLAELDNCNLAYWQYFPLCRECDRAITDPNGQVFIYETDVTKMDNVLAGNLFITFPKPKKVVSPGSMIIMTEPEVKGKWHTGRFLVVEVVNVLIETMAELPGYCLIEIVLPDIEDKKTFAMNRMAK